MSAPVRVLHVNDCAFTAANLLAVAGQRGLPWEFQALAGAERWVGAAAQARRAVLGVSWLGHLARRSLHVDLLHVHFATVVHHTRVIPRPYVLHAHGTDVRTLQYDPHYGPIVRRALTGARAVLYSTPDLAAHTVPRRPDALYLPVPIDVDALPAWKPQPRVFFASRWDDSKGVEGQLAVARELARALGRGVAIMGLDWGPGAAAAREAGVQLVPRRGHSGYLALLARSQVVVGQSAGILAASELEALGIGVPLVMTARHGLYGAAPPPVLDGAGTAEVVAAVLAASANPVAFAAAQQGPGWVRAHHSAADQVDRLLEIYSGLI